MSTYTMTTKVELPHHVTVNAVRAALGEQGFGILGDRSTVVEAVDSDILMHLTDSKTFETSTAEARPRLAAAPAVLD